VSAPSFWIVILDEDHRPLAAMPYSADPAAFEAKRIGVREELVSAPTAERAARVARLVSLAHEAHELASSEEAVRRRAFEEAAEYVSQLRTVQPLRPSAIYPGVTDGRLEALEDVERWARQRAGGP
jgi:hypothetical protein